MRKLLLASALLAATSFGESPPVKKAPAVLPTAEVMNKALLSAFAPLPTYYDNAANARTDAKVDLGRMLFYDARLSKNHDVSCNSCHDLQKFGVDGEQFSVGHKKQKGGRNSPTVYNAGAHVAQFWDGRAATLEDQAKGPVENPVEMANSAARVVATLKSIPEYVALFQKAFPESKEAVTFDNMAKAIGAFERGLVTPSRFDKFLGGDMQALTVDEQQGLKTFVEVGCTACHSGSALGGSMYQKLGLVQPYPDATDLGRFAVTKAEADKMMFRVPSLRNVAQTAPYFHNGKHTTLNEAVDLMAKHQLGRTLTAAQTKSIVAFLNSLTGEIPAAYVKKPVLPPNGKKTPKNDPS